MPDGAQVAYLKYKTGGGKLDFNTWYTQMWQPYAIKYPETDEEATAKALATVSGSWVPTGYMVNQFGQLVKKPAWMPSTTAATTAGELKPVDRWDTITDPDTGVLVIVGYDEDGKMVSYEYAGQAKEPTKLEGYATQNEAAIAAFHAGKQDEYRPAPLANGRWTIELNPGYGPYKTQQAAMNIAAQTPGHEAYQVSPGNWGIREKPIPEPISPYQEAELSWQEQQWQEQLGWQQSQAQMQQAEQERQYRAGLAGQPISWLQYASYTGEEPVVQPWMLPLMPQQYAGMVAGEKIPGWQGKGMSMANLPGLTTPSMQNWARMGPTAQQQFMGYGQAQGGITPEETQFRLRSTAPPGGWNTGLTWAR